MQIEISFDSFDHFLEKKKTNKLNTKKILLSSFQEILRKKSINKLTIEILEILIYISQNIHNQPIYYKIK